MKPSIHVSINKPKRVSLKNLLQAFSNLKNSRKINSDEIWRLASGQYAHLSSKGSREIDDSLCTSSDVYG